MAGIAVGGLGSGLDVNALVQQLVAAEGAAASVRLNRREADIQSELSGIGFLKTAASDLRTAISDLTDLADFSTTTATSTNSSVVSVSSNSEATPGSYSIEVQRLAVSQKLQTGTFTNKSDIIGTGELTFEFGTASGPFVLNNDKTSQTVDLSGTDGSLTSIRDAVNAANVGVNATIINEGSGFKLVFSSSDTGEANSLRITVDDDDGSDTNTSGLSQLAYDPDAGVGSGQNMTESVTAVDSLFILDGATINTASNSVTDVIEGVTLTLKKTDVGETDTLTIAQGTQVGQTEVETFIEAYNVFNATARTLSSFNVDTGETGILFGDSTLRSLQNFVSNLVSSPVENLASSFNTIASLGIRSDSQGQLSLDQTTFDSVTSEEPDIVARLFSNFGKTTNSNVTFSSASTTASAGNYAINLTQAATQGNAVGSAAANLTITDGVNDIVQFGIDDFVVTIDITAGTYASASALAAEVQNKINSNTFLQDEGGSVTVSESGGTLTVTSSRYGSNSSITVDSGNGASDLMGGAPVSTTGVDMVGTIGGTDAEVDGLNLTARGLTVTVNGSAIGSRGSVNYTIGQMNTLDSYLDSILDSGGIIPERESSLNGKIEDINEERQELGERLTRLETRLTNQFASLDSLLAGLQQTGNFLASALSNLPTPGGNNN